MSQEPAKLNRKKWWEDTLKSAEKETQQPYSMARRLLDKLRSKKVFAKLPLAELAAEFPRYYSVLSDQIHQPKSHDLRVSISSEEKHMALAECMADVLDVKFEIIDVDVQARAPSISNMQNDPPDP